MTNFTWKEKPPSLAQSLCFPATRATPYETLHVLIIILVFNIFFSLTATFGNIVIFLALNKESSFHPPSKLLFRCLAATDLCVGVVTQPMFVIYQISLVAERFHICTAAAMVSYVTGTFLCNVSLATLTVISVDRLLALQLKMRYRQAVTIRRVRAVVTALWLQSFAVGMLVFKNRLVYFSLSCALTLLSLVASTCCYLKMYCTLRRQRTQRVHDSQYQLVGQQIGTASIGLQSGTGYMKTVSSVLVFHLVLILCFLPYTMVRIMVAIAGRRLLVAEAVSSSMVYLNSTLNPLFYCWKIKEIRHEVKQIFRQRFCSQH